MLSFVWTQMRDLIPRLCLHIFFSNGFSAV